MNSERTTSQRYFECRDCRHRFTTASFRAECPHCGGDLRNIAVPRE